MSERPRKKIKKISPVWRDVWSFGSLLKEALTIQHRLKKFYQQKKTSNNPARQFADLVFQGKVKQALRCSRKKGQGVSFDWMTHSTRMVPHDRLRIPWSWNTPQEGAADPEVCIQVNPPEVHHACHLWCHQRYPHSFYCTTSERCLWSLWSRSLWLEETVYILSILLWFIM